jgi:hypothetical protein
MASARASGVRREGRPGVELIELFAVGALGPVLGRAVLAHGARGITDDTVRSAIARHKWGARGYGGANEVHRSAVTRRFKEWGLALAGSGQCAFCAEDD